MRLTLTPVRTPLIKPGDDIIDVFVHSIRRGKIKIENRDVIAIASKVVSLWQNRVVNYKLMKPSKRAVILSKKYKLHPGFVELVLREADMLLGGVKKALLTIKNNIFIANAGIDKSNAAKDFAILWPKEPKKTANKIRTLLEREFKSKIGIIITDSHCVPLRMGTVGLALGVSGFEPIVDERGNNDLYGNKMDITRRAIADELSSSALLLMGETSERIPLVVIKGYNINPTERPKNMSIKSKNCIFSALYPNSFR